MTLTTELNQKAKAILMRELGPVDYARFIQQYQEGTGDYTPEPSMNKPPALPQMANSPAQRAQSRYPQTNE